MPTATAEVKMITEPMLNWLITLVAERTEEPAKWLPLLPGLTMREAGFMIDTLKNKPKLREAGPKLPPPPAVEPGRYALPPMTEGGKVRRFRVAKSAAGTTYVKAITGGGGEQYLPGKVVCNAVLTEIAQAPMEASVLYGLSTGRCGVCHKTLTDPASVAAGIGPKCAKNF